MKRREEVQNSQSPNNEATIEFVIETSKRYDPDPDHSKHVALLALDIFDDLQDIHGYGASERHLLEIASRLHDIGWSRVVSGKHHKLSRDIILKLDILGLSNSQRFMCALIARYHTKALPDVARHRHFALLDRKQREIVEWLAGMLRVADGLDCSHANLVKRLKCTIKSKIVRIHLESAGNCRREMEKARLKQELLLKKLERMIEYRC
jgi:exopolyphosphatase/guanosine-5'-triphosphate,3'-diphosphate pyrophosphatase